jgi:predicted transcriptional regulator
MDDVSDNTPPDWLAALDRADAEIAAGLFVSSDEVHRLLQESITELEAKATDSQLRAINRR